MTIRKKSLLYLLLFAVLLCFAFSTAAMLFGKAEATNGFALTNGELKESYMVGDTVTIPEGKFTVGGQEVSAEFVVVCPDGQGIAEKTLKVTSAGKYDVRYQAVRDGKVLQEVYSFQVNNTLYSAGSKSTVRLGKASEFTPYSAGGQTGAVVEIANGDTFEYSQAIDMTGKTANDKLITFSILPSTAGTSDVTKIYLRLTDAMDPENYVTIRVKKVGSGVAWKEQWSYVDVYANGQTPMGLEGNNGTFIYEGIGYSLHKNSNDYGAGVRLSMSGAPAYPDVDNNTVGTETLSLSMDYAKKRLYANGALVLDLDDPVFQALQWEGFSFDKCKLSIWGDGYTSATMGLLITSVNGNADFAENVFVDEEAPIIQVENEEDLLTSNAVVDRKFVIPSAVAYDTTDGRLDVRVAVYNNYNTGLQRNIAVTDGMFLPTKSKVYTIVYTATDRSGNSASAAYDVKAIVLEDLPELTHADVPQICNVGEQVEIGYPLVSESYGDWTVDISAEVDGSVYEVATVKSTDEARAIYFRPMHSGACKIRYDYSDRLCNLEMEYTVEVSQNGAAQILDEPIVPKYVVKGVEYETPQLMGYKFVNGAAVNAKTDVYITSSADYTSAAAYTADTFKVTSGANVYITFVLDEAIKQCVVPVVDVERDGGFKVANYFIGFKSFSSSTSSTEFVVANNAGNYELSFANALQVFDLNLSFLMDEATTSYSALEIILEDAADASKKIVSRYDFAGSTFNFTVNGGKVNSVAKDYLGTDLTFSYNTIKGTISPCAGYSFLMSNVDGKDVGEFESLKAYLTIRLIGVANENKASITVSKLNNQPINNATRDTIRPESTKNVKKGDINLGTVVDIEPFYYADVLQAYCKATIKVTAPDGSVVYSTDGVKLEGQLDLTQTYSIKLEQSGYYFVSYVVKHPNNRNLEYEYSISAKSLAAPEITLGDYSTSAKVGSTVEVATATVAAATGDCEVRIVVLRPNYMMDLITDGTFVADEKGIYTVYYTVYDENQNVNFAQYTVTVK